MPRIHPEVDLGGERNECPTCGALFATNAAFDAHRVGKFATLKQPNTRRCMTADEMHMAGLRQDRAGFLLTEAEHKYRPTILKPRMDSQSAAVQHDLPPAISKSEGVEP